MVTRQKLWGGYIAYFVAMIVAVGVFLYRSIESGEMDIAILSIVLFSQFGYWFGYLYFGRND